jgi:acylphosphatase
VSALHVLVRGRVQGVGFRWFVRERARETGVKGWVRNRDDGSVEVAAEGESDDLQKFVAALRRGPAGAHVTALDDIAEPPDPTVGDSFSILRERT